MTNRRPTETVGQQLAAKQWDTSGVDCGRARYLAQYPCCTIVRVEFEKRGNALLVTLIDLFAFCNRLCRHLTVAATKQSSIDRRSDQLQFGRPKEKRFSDIDRGTHSHSQLTFECQRYRAMPASPLPHQHSVTRSTAALRACASAIDNQQLPGSTVPQVKI